MTASARAAAGIGPEWRGAALPGDGLLHPFAAASVALLLVNDHVLKSTVPSWWTGKLSDVAALIVLGLVIQAAAELLGAPIGRRVLGWSLVTSGVALVAIKLVPVAGELYRWSLGAAQWIPAAIGAALGGHPAPGVVPVALTRDPTDLLALPVLFVAWFLFRDRHAPIGAGGACRRWD
jgi:hypothetical protein